MTALLSSMASHKEQIGECHLLKERTLPEIVRTLFDISTSRFGATAAARRYQRVATRDEKADK